MTRGVRHLVPLAVLTALAGCAADSPPPPPAGPSPIDLAQPAVRGGQNGLEVRVWVVEGQEHVLSWLVGEYGPRPTAMPDSVREAWRASGLRVAAIPVDALSAIRGSLRLVGPAQREWFGQSPGWTEIIRGRSIRAGTAIRIADGTLRVPEGRLRVLARAWTVPADADASPALHLELAAQLERAGAGRESFMPALASELEAGVVFPRLTGRMQLDAGSALVLIPYSDVAGDEDGDAGGGFGPPEPAVPTLGEAMLTSLEPNAIAPARRRAIAVLVPRLPERFRLAAGGGGSPDPAVVASP